MGSTQETQESRLDRVQQVNKHIAEADDAAQRVKAKTQERLSRSEKH